MSNPTITELFGEPISVYTVAQGVEDGFMVDATSATTLEAGYRLPVTFTRKAWDDLVTWERGGCQDEQGRLWDVLWMMRRAAKAAVAEPGERYRFAMLRIPNRTKSGNLSNSERAVTVRVDVTVQAYDATGRPCLTVLLPGED